MASRKEILELLANGKITADEAAEMLTAVNLAAEEPAGEKAAVPEMEPDNKSEIEVEEEIVVSKADVAGNAPTWFRVKVSNLDTGKSRVNVNIPLKMFKFGMKIGRRFAPEIEELNWDELDGMVNNMQRGMLVEVEDEDSNEHVQVFLE